MALKKIYEWFSTPFTDKQTDYQQCDTSVLYLYANRKIIIYKILYSHTLCVVIFYFRNLLNDEQKQILLTVVYFANGFFILFILITV